MSKVKGRLDLAAVVAMKPEKKNRENTMGKYVLEEKYGENIGVTCQKQMDVF